jgi:hypothetical protein
MFSQFESFTNLPKPFELFTKKRDEYVKEGFREGIDATAAASPSATATDDKNKGKTTNLTGILVAVFFILFVLVGMIYYFNSMIFLKTKLNIPYKSADFFQKFKGYMVGSKVTIFIIIWLVVFCNNLLLMDTVFNNHEYTNIFYTTTIYFWGIVGATFLVIGNVPSLVEVFENTIGFSLLSSPLFNLKNTMEIFKNRNFKSEQFKVPCDFLITTFNLPSFHEQFENLVEQYPNNAEYTGVTPTYKTSKTDFYIDITGWEGTDVAERPDKNPDKNDNRTVKARLELLKQVLTKNTIGHFMWALLASYVSVLLTVNTVTQ